MAAETIFKTAVKTETDLRIFLVVVLLRANPSTGQMVAHGVCQRQIIVAIGGHITILHHRVVDVTTERLLHVGNVLHQRDSLDANLLAAILIGLRSGGHRWSARGRC